MTNQYSVFSVCMSVYRNDDVLFLQQALDSIMQQSYMPDEVVLVVDGPVSDELRNAIESKAQEYAQIKPVYLPENKGLGNALREALLHANNAIIARMDSDDISMPGRFEKQLEYLQSHPDVDLVGGQITEFIDTPDNIVAKRNVPLSHEEIIKYMRVRCPFNHPTVMFRKKAVLDAGNYQDWFWNEDYYLWIRMMEHGCRFANLPEVLVNMRSGEDQYSRRGGKKYFRSEKEIQKLMLNKGFISWPRYCFNVVARWGVQVAMPNWLRGFVFQRLFRK